MAILDTAQTTTTEPRGQKLAHDQHPKGRVSMTRTKFLTTPKSRRSILKGLGVAAVGISLSSSKFAWAADEEPKLNFYN